MIIKKYFYLTFLFLILPVFSLFSCKSEQAISKAEPVNLSNFDSYYEGIFLNNKEILSMFSSMRSQQPFENQSSNFHIKAKEMPASLHSHLYGKKVKVHITKYKIGTVLGESGYPTYNEGFQVELESKNEELQALLNEYQKNYYITGAYQEDERYTESVDFSDGIPVDLYVNGTFGLCFSNDIFLAKK